MTKDKQAIQKMAEDAIPLKLEESDPIGFVNDAYDRENWIKGYTAAVEDMEKEAVRFAEWLIDTYDVYAHAEPTAADLLTLYRESIKKGGCDGK